jgi:type 1 glutamine amidotransferase
MRVSLACFALFAIALFATVSAAAGADKALTVHFISGSGEYKSEPSLKEFQQHLEKNYRVKVTASWGKDGGSAVMGLEELPKADLLLVFARRMKLPEEQMKIIRAHWEQGKPVIGVRTAGHAFQQADNDLFDKQVLGGHYKGHYGAEVVKVVAEAAQAKHPILNDVGPFESRKLYGAGELAKDTTVLQTGDIGKAKHPVTIIHEYKGGRMFFTSLGVPEDFANENFRRMLTNAVFWTAKADPDSFKK